MDLPDEESAMPAVPFARHSLALSLLALQGLPAFAAEEAPVTAPAAVEAPAAPAPAEAPASTGTPAATPAEETASAPALAPVVVRSQALDYVAEKPASPKYTEPLRDTPQTVKIVTKEAIEDQGLLSLREILSTVPGITFGAGEGGGGYGDNISIRGFSSSNDIAIDGVRDSAQYTRSDPFNLEQVEVVKGSSSVYSGAGAIGGTVNLVSKTPKADEFTNASIGIGSDQYQRATLDTNKPLDDTTAVRVNVMSHAADVPGRDYETLERWGVAPSVAFGLGTDTSLSLALFHQEDTNTPQYGVPFYNGRALPGVDPSNYYGYHNIDTQQNEVDTFTAIFDHRFNDNVKLRNLARIGETDQFLIVDPPQGSWCLPENGDPAGRAPTGWSQTANPNPSDPLVITTNTSGYTNCARAWSATPGATTAPNYVYGNGPTLTPGQYQPSGPRGNVRDTNNTIIVDQLDVTWNFATGTIDHTMVTGLSLSHETYSFLGYNEFRYANGWAQNPSVDGFPIMDVFNPNSFYEGPRNRTLTAKTEAEQDNRAIYVFDTLEFTEQWLFSAGIRYEHTKTKNKSFGVNVYTAPSTTTPNPVQPADIGSLTGVNTTVNSDSDLFSWRTGLVYKPVEIGSIYISYASSMTPSTATVNGTCTATSTTGTANCTVDPEEAETWELGTKWDLLDQRLSFTSALFRNERTNYRVNDPGNPDNPTGAQQLDGRSRVDGLELGVAGLLAKNWSIFANYTFQDSEVLQGASDFVANGGATGTEADWIKGDPLTNVPEHAASIWTTWDATRKLQFGYGITYQGEVYLTQHGGIARTGSGAPSPTQYVGRTTIPLVQSEDYFVHNTSVTYRLDRNMTVQMNIKNLFDEVYYTRMRNNGWATPGDARSTVITVNYAF